MTEERGLTVYDVNALQNARKVIMQKPEESMRYLVGNAPTLEKGLLALVLSALLENTRQHNEIVKFALAVTEYLKKT